MNPDKDNEVLKAEIIKHIAKVHGLDKSFLRFFSDMGMELDDEEPKVRRRSAVVEDYLKRKGIK